MDLLGLIKLPEGIDNVIVWVIALNLLLSGISAALEKVKDKTSTDADNKAYAAIHKIAHVLQKVIDFVSANRSHKK